MSINALNILTCFAGYGDVSEGTNSDGYVYFAEEDTENHGHARYLTELAGHNHFGLDRSFVATVCTLPSTYDGNELDYMVFLDEWGTVSIKISNNW